MFQAIYVEHAVLLVDESSSIDCRHSAKNAGQGGAGILLWGEVSTPRFSPPFPSGSLFTEDLYANLMAETVIYCGVQGKLGVLQLSLCYQPSAETITIVIMKARDLKAKDINGLSGKTPSHRLIISVYVYVM